MDSSQVVTINLDETIITTRPWAKELLKTTMEISKKMVLRWCSIVVKIGEADLDIGEYTRIFVDEINNLFEAMIEDINKIQEKRLDKIEDLLQHLQDLCQNLHLEIPAVDDHDKRSLGDLRKHLLTKTEEFERILNIRRKEVVDLNLRQTRLCRRLGRQLCSLQESPLPLPEETEIFKAQLETLETEAMEREKLFFQRRKTILEMVNEYNVPPNLDFEREIIGLGKNEVRIKDTEMEQLELYYKKLVAESDSIQKEIEDLRTKIDHMWNLLETDIAYRDSFVQNSRGNSLNTLAALKAEIARLNALKTTNLKTFIFRQRAELEELWNNCYCAEEAKRSFPFYYSSCYNEYLFELQDVELTKWKRFYADNLDIFQLISQHKKLWEQHLELESNSEDARRFKNRGGQLLTEEKKRNKLKKRIPAVEEKMLDLANDYYVHSHQHFQIFGKTIQEYIDHLHFEKDKRLKQKLSAKKLEREPSPTMHVGRTLFPRVSPSSTSRNITERKVTATPSREPIKKLKVPSGKKSPKSGMPKVNTSISNRRRSSRGKGKKLFKRKEVHNATTSTDYDEFEEEVSSKDSCRSTIFASKESHQNPETPKQSVLPKLVLTTPAHSERVLTPKGNTYVTKTPQKK